MCLFVYSICAYVHLYMYVLGVGISVCVRILIYRYYPKDFLSDCSRG